MTSSHYIEQSLDPIVLEKAIAEANRRQETNEGLGLLGRNAGPASGNKALEIHVLGAKGELATACFLGIESQIFKDKTPKRGSVDLPPNIDVKTRSKHWMDLVVQLDDDPYKVFVHATCQDHIVRLHGWSYGHRIMKDQFKLDPAHGRPAYFVKPAVLHSMHDLRGIIHDLNRIHETHI